MSAPALRAARTESGSPSNRLCPLVGRWAMMLLAQYHSCLPYPLALIKGHLRSRGGKSGGHGGLAYDGSLSWRSSDATIKATFAPSWPPHAGPQFPRWP